jgi:hypothetical protein
MVLPTTRLAALKPMLDQAKASTDTAVRTSLILRWIESPQDPLLESMIAGGTDMARADAATVQDPGSKEVQTKQAAERQARSLSLRAQAVRALLESRARAASELEQIGDSPAVLGGTVAPEMVLPTSR